MGCYNKCFIFSLTTRLLRHEVDGIHVVDGMGEPNYNQTLETKLKTDDTTLYIVVGVMSNLALWLMVVVAAIFYVRLRKRKARAAAVRHTYSAQLYQGSGVGREGGRGGGAGGGGGSWGGGGGGGGGGVPNNPYFHEKAVRGMCCLTLYLRN